MYNRTSLVLNEDAKKRGLAPIYYRKRTWTTQPLPYQTLQQIQNTVRVPASVYTGNLATLSVQDNPVWNAQSDQSAPSNPGYTTRTTSRPGGQAPGGKGCDVKHGNYERYLNRLKGDNLKRNISNTITGKTAIVNGCVCDKTNNQIVYREKRHQPSHDIDFAFSEGDDVYAKEIGSEYYSRAVIVSNDGNNNYTIRYDYDEKVETKHISELRIFTNCP
jgi:hypothetical protein